MIIQEVTSWNDYDYLKTIVHSHKDNCSNVYSYLDSNRRINMFYVQDDMIIHRIFMGGRLILKKIYHPQIQFTEEVFEIYKTGGQNAK